MMKQNRIDDLANHYWLKGALYRRKMMSPTKLYGAVFFGVAGSMFSMMPTLTMHIGQTLTYAGITASLMGGMYTMQEKDFVNSINFVKDESSPYNGKLKINVSTGPLMTSKDIFVDVHECRGLLSLGNDDLGEEDVDTNVLHINSYYEGSTGEFKKDASETLVLPADGWRDETMLDWVLSLKAPDSNFSDKSSLDVLFNDLMLEEFDDKV